jgi:SAM-dependent MidA family methyltransferase
MKKISHNTYLQSLGLFTLALQHANKAEEFREALEKLLEIDPYGYMSDAVYNGGTEGDFDTALRLEEIEVETN